jgi:hypothetical protein
MIKSNCKQKEILREEKNNIIIYLDTDVEVRKPLGGLLDNDMYMGFEHEGEVNTGIGFGAIKRFPVLKQMIEMYSATSFKNDDGTYNMTTCNIYTKKTLQKEGFALNDKYQNINGLSIYPSEYFSPKSFTATSDTYSVHYYALSWKSEDRNANKFKICLMTLFGARAGSFVCNGLYVYRTAGVRGVWRKMRGKEWQGENLG